MPIWTFKCEACGHVEEIVQLSKNDSDAACPSLCPECDALLTFELQVTPLGRMHFKGPGFHVNDYRKPRPVDTKTTHAVGSPSRRGDS